VEEVGHSILTAGVSRWGKNHLAFFLT